MLILGTHFKSYRLVIWKLKKLKNGFWKIKVSILDRESTLTFLSKVKKHYSIIKFRIHLNSLVAPLPNNQVIVSYDCETVFIAFEPRLYRQTKVLRAQWVSVFQRESIS